MFSPPKEYMILHFVLTGFKYSVRILSTLAASAMAIVVVSDTIHFLFTNSVTSLFKSDLIQATWPTKTYKLVKRPADRQAELKTYNIEHNQHITALQTYLPGWTLLQY